METKEKYYTPELKEIHDGFEYEYLTVNDEWEKDIFGSIKPEDTENVDYDLITRVFADNPNNIRVKITDREDIESCGFEEYKETGAYDMFFYKDSFSIGKRKNGKYEICLWHIKPEDNNGSGMAETLFLGEIKNKSELQVILKQTGVTNGN